MPEDLKFSIAHRPRVTKRMHLELDENGGLVLVVPRHWSGAVIRRTLAQNLHKVERFLTRSRTPPGKPLEYRWGEAHLYLGKRYPLRISRAVGKRSKISLTNGEICMQATSLEREDLKRYLQNWYGKQASQVFQSRLRKVSQNAPWADQNSLCLKPRRMKRTWGNCSSQGVIKLNTHLVKAPVTLIDSVIAHELCHLQEMNHSKAFYVLLEQLNPAWRQDRQELRINGPAYLLT